MVLLGLWVATGSGLTGFQVRGGEICGCDLRGDGVRPSEGGGGKIPRWGLLVRFAGQPERKEKKKF